MARRLFTLLAALSLLLCVAVGVLWVRNHLLLGGSHYDAVVLTKLGPAGHWRAVAFTHRGRVHAEWWHSTNWPPLPPDDSRLSPWRVARVGSGTMDDIDPDTATLGFRFRHLTMSGRGITNLREAVVPLWSILLPSAVMPALWFRRRVRQRMRRRRHLCQTCGYDLRATPGRCPECGTSAPSAR